MTNELVLQPAWDLVQATLGDFTSSPGFILTAVMLGVYVPGILFSIIDVYVTRRLTLKDSWAVYWRAMKGYSTAYVAAMALFLLVPMPAAIQLKLPAAAPTVPAFCLDMLLYFLVGDFCSYVWHRLEHHYKWYARHVHSVHHFDKPPLSIWTAMVVHPVEGLTVFTFFHLYGLVADIHPFTFFIAAFSLTAVTMITHCGYRIPVYDRLFANAPGHDCHHSSRTPTNVSVVLTICDRMFGTYQRA